MEHLSPQIKVLTKSQEHDNHRMEQQGPPEESPQLEQPCQILRKKCKKSTSVGGDTQLQSHMLRTVTQEDSKFEVSLSNSATLSQNEI